MLAAFKFPEDNYADYNQYNSKHSPYINRVLLGNENIKMIKENSLEHLPGYHQPKSKRRSNLLKCQDNGSYIKCTEHATHPCIKKIIPQILVMC